MIVWGVTGNNHDASLAVMEWRVAGLTDHYNLKLKWAGMSKDFSGIPGDPTLCPKLMAEVRANPKWAFPAKIYFYEKPFKKTMRQLIAGQGWNLGIKDIQTLCSLIDQFSLKDNIINETYFARRFLESAIYLSFTSSLNFLYENINPITKNIIRIGYQGLSNLKIAKNIFIKQAMGRINLID